MDAKASANKKERKPRAKKAANDSNSSSSRRAQQQQHPRPADSSGASEGAPSPSFDFDSYGKRAGWSHVPEDKDQAVVTTPYGRGTVVRTRREGNGAVVVMREVELTDWTSAAAAADPGGARRPAAATLYSPVDFDSVTPQLYDDVICSFGRGRVIEIRAQGRASAPSSSNGSVVVVLLSSWRLAGRSRVTCYLSSASVKVVRPKRLYEMPVHEKVEHAQELKSRANRLFASSNGSRIKGQRQKRGGGGGGGGASCHYREALDLYVRAIEAVRNVQHKADSPNELRADLLVLLITCYNNAGMCCSLMLSRDDDKDDRRGGRWDDAARYAGSALTLIEALEEKRGLKIHTLLNREGTPDTKVFGEWKVKALVLKARALMERRNADVDQAAELLKEAHGVIASYRSDGPENGGGSGGSGSASALLSMEKEVGRLRASCKERRKRLREREKKQALKMFSAASYYEEEKKEKSSPDSSPPSSPFHAGDGEPRFRSIGAADEHAEADEGAADRGSAARKRVSFSEHVSERLFQPEDRRSKKADRATNRLRFPTMIGSGLWAQRPQAVLYAGLGIAVGAILTLASVRWAPRIKR